MFEKKLLDTLQRVFGVKKVTLDQPSIEAPEQECLFVLVETSDNRVKDGRVTAKVTGKISIFGNSDKIPYGFFSKRISQAMPGDVAPIFFFEFESNANQYRNIVQRTCSFVYFFNGQYDPDVGTITSIEFEEPNS